MRLNVFLTKSVSEFLSLFVFQRCSWPVLLTGRTARTGSCTVGSPLPVSSRTTPSTAASWVKLLQSEIWSLSVSASLLFCFQMSLCFLPFLTAESRFLFPSLSFSPLFLSPLSPSLLPPFPHSPSLSFSLSPSLSLFVPPLLYLSLLALLSLCTPLSLCPSLLPLYISLSLPISVSVSHCKSPLVLFLFQLSIAICHFKQNCIYSGWEIPRKERHFTLRLSVYHIALPGKLETTHLRPFVYRKLSNVINIKNWNWMSSSLLNCKNYLVHWWYEKTSQLVRSFPADSFNVVFVQCTTEKIMELCLWGF